MSLDFQQRNGGNIIPKMPTRAGRALWICNMSWMTCCRRHKMKAASVKSCMSFLEAGNIHLHSHHGFSCQFITFVQHPLCQLQPLSFAHPPLQLCVLLAVHRPCLRLHRPAVLLGIENSIACTNGCCLARSAGSSKNQGPKVIDHHRDVHG